MYKVARWYFILNPIITMYKTAGWRRDDSRMTKTGGMTFSEAPSSRESLWVFIACAHLEKNMHAMTLTTHHPRAARSPRRSPSIRPRQAPLSRASTSVSTPRPPAPLSPGMTYITAGPVGIHVPYLSYLEPNPTILKARKFLALWHRHFLTSTIFYLSMKTVVR